MSQCSFERMGTWRGVILKKVVSGKLTLFVRFEVFTALTMKNSVFWDMAPCGFYKYFLQPVSVASYC
jgi:hypothetical protein